MCVNKKCVHKSFFPPTFSEVMASILLFIISGFSSAAGIGASSTLMPVFILILNFSPHDAIPMSKFMIFTATVSSFIINLWQKHPFRQGPPLDYNLAGVLIPMILFGNMIGVVLNKIFPDSIIFIGLVFVLMLVSYTTTYK